MTDMTLTNPSWLKTYLSTPPRPIQELFGVRLPWLSHLDHPSELSSEGWWPRLTINSRVVADIRQVSRFDPDDAMVIKKPVGLRHYTWSQVMSYCRISSARIAED